jgi:hypothetical protein
METLDLITMTDNNNIDGHEIERTTFNRDIEEFYEMLGQERGISEEEIVRMMYAMEIVQSRVPNYEELYEQTYNESFDGQDMTLIRQEYRLQFLREANKIFFNNLTYRMANEENLTLEDVFALMTIYEADLNYHLKYNQSDSLGASRTFLIEYSDMQANFLASIANANNMEYEDVLNLYNSYQLFSNVDGKITLNASFNWLNQDQQAWLLSKARGERISYTQPINIIVSNTLNKSNSK